MKWNDKYFIKFCIVGVVSTVTLYSAYYLLLMLNLNHSISYSIAYIIAFIVNFLLTTSFTFKVKANKNNGLGFIITNIINYFISLLFLNLFVKIGLDERVALIPTLCISVPINYLMVKFVMKRKAE